MPPALLRPHATHASTPSMQTHHTTYPPYTRSPSTHASTSSTPPMPTTLARFPRKHATHATYASTHQCKYAIQASKSSAPFLKLV